MSLTFGQMMAEFEKVPTLKVLHVLPLFTARAGGPVAAVSQSAEEMTRIGVRSTIASTTMGHVPSRRSSRAVAADELPANHDALDFHLFDVREPRRLVRSPDLAKYLRREVPNVDVVHIHSLWLYPQFAAFSAARSAKIPYIVSPRGALDPYLRRRGRLRKALTNAIWQSAMLEQAAAIHVTTTEEQRLIADIAPEVRRFVVPNGVRVTDFDSKGDGDEFRQKFVAGAGGPIVLFIGRISRKKGVDVLIESVAKAHPDVGGVQLVVAGPDDEGLTDGLLAQARQLGIQDRVHFVGPVYGVDRRNALAAATIWALTSHTENFGIAVVEAMAAGLPTVITPGVNLAADAVAAGAAAVAAADAQPFGALLTRLLQDHAAREQLSRRARVFAGRYDWEVVAPQLKAMYEAVVSGG